MIRNPQKLRDFEDRLIASTPVDVKENFRIVNELFLHAKALGKFPSENLLEGLEEKIKFIRVLNAIRNSP